MFIVFTFIGIFLVDNIARGAEVVIVSQTSYTNTDAMSINQTFGQTFTSDSVYCNISKASFLATTNKDQYNVEYKIYESDLITLVASSTGKLSCTGGGSSYYCYKGTPTQTLKASTTYYIQWKLTTSTVGSRINVNNPYAGGKSYKGGTAFNNYDRLFYVYADDTLSCSPKQECGNGIIEPPEFCDDGRDQDLIYYAGCNTTCNGYIINIMDIGILSYYGTTTAITASTTIEVGQLISPILLYFFIFSIFAVILFLIKLFFYSK